MKNIYKLGRIKYMNIKIQFYQVYGELLASCIQSFKTPVDLCMSIDTSFDLFVKLESDIDC